MVDLEPEDPIDAATAVMLFRRELGRYGLHQQRIDRFTLALDAGVSDWNLEIGTSYHNVRIRVTKASLEGEHHSNPNRRRESVDLTFDKHVDQDAAIWTWLRLKVEEARQEVAGQVAKANARLNQQIAEKVAIEPDSEAEVDWP